MRGRGKLAIVAALILVLIALWVGIPAERAVSLVELHGGSPIVAPAGLPVRTVQFAATDGVPLRGWLVPGSPVGPLIILAAGFKADRMSMLPYARFLHAAGYNVLLYDSRGTGQSGGRFSFGAREVDDVLGAIRWGRDEGARRIGLLGVSLGSGEVIVAAARDRAVRAVVADSPYVDQKATVDYLDYLHVRHMSIPLAPLAPSLIDRLAGTRVASFRPIAAITRIRPRGVLLIHASHDTNPTTPLADALALHRAAGRRASLWLAPRGGHAAALAAQPAAYRRHVLLFFARYLGR